MNLNVSINLSKFIISRESASHSCSIPVLFIYIWLLNGGLRAECVTSLIPLFPLHPVGLQSIYAFASALASGIILLSYQMCSVIELGYGRVEIEPGDTMPMPIGMDFHSTNSRSTLMDYDARNRCRDTSHRIIFGCIRFSPQPIHKLQLLHRHHRT